MADGSIRIPVDVDIQDAETDLDRLKDAAERAAEEIAKASAHMAEAAVPTSSKGWGREFQKTLSDMAKTGAAADAAVKAGDLEAADRLGQLYADQEDKLAKIAEHLNETVMLEQQRAAQAQAEKEGAEAAKEQAKAEKEAAKDAEKLRKEQEKAAAASKKHGEQLKHAIGGQIKSIIGKISMLGIALLGVRSAWQLIRSAINDVKSTNEYVSGQIDGFKNMLATAIEPLIVQIVQWLSTAVTYVNAFIAALTGVDLIANANARAINKQAKATAGAAKAAAQLAGFDEMNKLSDNSGGGGGGGASGMFQPADIDTSAVEGFVNRIKQIIDESGIGAKIQEFLDKFSGLDLEAIFKPIKDVAVLLIGDALQNALDLIDDVLDLLLDIQSGNVLGVICDIFMLMWDLGTGWMRPLLAIIDGLFGTDTLGFYKEMRSALNKFMDLLGHASSWQEFFDGVVEIAMTHPHIKALSEAIAKVITFIRNLGVTVISTAGNIFSPVIAAIGKLWSWIDKNAIQPIKTFLSGFWQNQISPVLSKLWEITGTVAKIATALFKAAETYVLQPIGRWIAGLWQKFVDNVLKPVQTWATGVGAWIYKNIYTPVVNWLKNIYNRAVDIFKSVGTTVMTFVGGAFKATINGILGAIQTTINTFIRLLNGAVDLINKIPGVNISRVSELTIPRLAAGGIVNNPGRGVPLVAGEAGREAILPLDANTEWMDTLAEKINGGGGRPLQISLNINGRKLQEFLIDLGARRAFATNGGAV